MPGWQIHCKGSENIPPQQIFSPISTFILRLPIQMTPIHFNISGARSAVSTPLSISPSEAYAP